MFLSLAHSLESFRDIIKILKTEYGPTEQAKMGSKNMDSSTKNAFFHKKLCIKSVNII